MEYKTLEDLQKMLNDINESITRPYTHYILFKNLHEKITNKNQQFKGVIDKNSITFSLMYFGNRDLMLLGLSKIFDKNSKRINIYKIINFLKENYKKLNKQGQEYFVDKDFFSTFKPIIYTEILEIEDELDKENQILSKIKTYKDTKLSHADHIKEIDMVTFEEIKHIFKIFMRVVNQIDLKFLSNSTDNQFLKEQVNDDINYLFDELTKKTR